MGKLILILVMLVLPLQGYAASLAVCAHDAQAAALDHAMHDEHAPASHSGASPDGGCEGCASCHMCSAIVMPIIVATPQADPDALGRSHAPQSFDPVFPDQPQRPPLSRFV